jgi:phytanoyl-CoA hydroxylase
LETLLGEPALAVQTMFYYKPPGARGQAMHQDQFYLLVEPGTCMAAWTAIDDCDEENGGMMVVPNTDDIDVVCPTDTADAAASFTKHYVAVPEGKKPLLVRMKAGDTLFFNGSLIHGSGPNRSKTRFRRSFIAHYATGDAQKIASYYQPAYRMDGSVVGLETNTAGGPCGAGWAGGTH